MTELGFKMLSLGWSTKHQNFKRLFNEKLAMFDFRLFAQCQKILLTLLYLCKLLSVSKELDMSVDRQVITFELSKTVCFSAVYPLERSCFCNLVFVQFGLDKKRKVNAKFS